MPVIGGAAFDETGVYRYALWREWAPGPRVAFVLLNPSTAGAMSDDPTIRRCIGFARALGFGALEVVNVCALRSTRPRALARHPDPFGPANAAAVGQAARRAGLVIAGWGNHGAPFAEQAVDALRGVDLHCLGLTALGHPRHPLYLPRGTATRRYDEGPRTRAALFVRR